MKQNILQNVIGFVLKYIWIFCALLMVFELVSVTYTATILMQQSAAGVMQSVSGEVSGRVDGVLRLLKGMAGDRRFSDTSKPLYDRAIQALPYQESYNLYMIAMTDQEVNVISADETEPPAEPYSLAYRDYMQRLYATGEDQITDAMLSGDGTETMNYTIAVPVLEEDKVVGSIFGSIYFDDIETTLSQQSLNKGSAFYLFGENNTIMAGDNRQIYGKSFAELSRDSWFWTSDMDSIDRSMGEGGAGSFWHWDSDGLVYATYQRVEPTNWTILYRVQFMSVFTNLFPGMCAKMLFYILLCAAVSILGQRYLSRLLSQVNHLLNRMTVIQKELFQSEQPDYDNLLELTQQGLTDQLTGLSTRAVLFKKMLPMTDQPQASGAIVFVDLDDLKRINDNFGHEGGDCALIYFAQVFKRYEQQYGAVAARYGGDEFIVILDGMGDKESTEIAEKLCADLNTLITTKDHSFEIHGSLGVSFYPQHGTKPEELICKADLALYTAKQTGKNRCAFFADTQVIL